MGDELGTDRIAQLVGQRIVPTKLGKKTSSAHTAPYGRVSDIDVWQDSSHRARGDQEHLYLTAGAKQITRIPCGEADVDCPSQTIFGKPRKPVFRPQQHVPKTSGSTAPLEDFLCCLRIA